MNESPRPTWFSLRGSPFPPGKTSGITPLCWSSLGVFIVVDLIWLPISPLVFKPSNFWTIGQIVLPSVCALCILPLVLRRLEGDPSTIASGIRTAARRVNMLAQALAFTASINLAGAAYVYLATSAGLPLHDGRLASLDQALGFDWLGFLAIANSSHAISSVLVAAYHSTPYQMVALYLLLCFRGRERRVAEFMALLSVSSIAVGAIMLLVPASGAYAHYRPPRELFDGFSQDAGMWHYETLVRLRTEAAPLLDFAQMQGLVTFPSFHTVLAILTAYAFRGMRFLALPAVILNALVIVSTLPEGGHFLVDLIAGAIIAIVSIALVRWERSGWDSSLFSLVWQQR